MGQQYTRNDISDSGGNFSDPNVVWYAVGVHAMMQRSLSDPASWWYFAAIHGQWVTQTDPTSRSWAQVNPPPDVPTSPVPSDTSLWDQCQHGTWYFVPWHRGYLMALEAQLRQDIVAAGGPATWALPYWNYFQNPQMPGDFAATTLPATLPDGSPFPAGLGGQTNPLYVTDRYGPDGDGNIYIPQGGISADCLNDSTYTGTSANGGFGGGITTFSHFSGLTGGLESNPHNNVHVIVGSTKNNSGDYTEEGLMIDPNLAALDPIFYMHHCLIDLLWAYWNVALGRSNPSDPAWVNGPTPEFAMPWPQSQPWKYTPGDVGNIQVLNYTYDMLQNTALAAASGFPSPKAQPVALAARLAHLGAPALEAAARPQIVAPPRAAELLGASTSSLIVNGGVSRASVKLDSTVNKKLMSSLSLESTPDQPDQVFLKLEGITGTRGATVLDVFVNLPAGANPAENPQQKAGSVGLFGLKQASDKNGKHGGSGLTFSLDITSIVDDLHLGKTLDAGSLDVLLVPYRPLPAGTDIKVGRVSVYRVTH
ncbi:tyrosinase family protein [Brevifollis gellanilyticus]|uniref:Tyrosinase copper-binding domain-containing protein n=1 Tax=Brevifollis gellanilyticus TaxID=748831 RepID=A0A512M2B1_9BACT|nr:tyrosinase family protein [Brevifollis gellanilyticus]GEP40876.1 hypothetical protein BGE01nite_01670 [Brevifollis gellanilyticus]